MRRFHLAFAFIIFLLSACASEENNLLTSTPESIETQTPIAITDRPTSLPTQTEVVASPTQEPKPLSAEGPWILVADNSETKFFDVMNLNGTGASSIDFLSEDKYWDALPSSNGGLVAFRTSYPCWNSLDIENNFSPEILVVKFPEKEVVWRTSLLSEDALLKIQNEEDDFFFLGAHPLLGIATNPENFAWSPNGQYLAFTAAPENEKAGVYVYDVKENTLKLLTESIETPYIRDWSPDGQWILASDIETYYPCDYYDFDVSGNWAVSVSGETKFLYEPTSIDEIAGWTSNKTFVVFSWRFESPFTNIREINVHTNTISTIYEDLFCNMSLGKNSGEVFLVFNDAPFCKLNIPLGIYRKKAGEPLQLLQSGRYNFLKWYSDPNIFFATRYTNEKDYQDYNTNMVFLDENGAVEFDLDIDDEFNWTGTSPDGKWLVIKKLGEDSLEIYSNDGVYETTIELVDGRHLISWFNNSEKLFVHYYEDHFIIVFSPSENWREAIIALPQHEIDKQNPSDYIFGKIYFVYP